RDSAPERDRDPSRARGQPLAHRSPASHRRLCAGGTRRHGWSYSWTLVIRFAGWVDAKADAARHRVVGRTEPRNLGGDVRILPPRYVDVCARTGFENFT